jgi:hypothetical protein
LKSKLEVVAAGAGAGASVVSTKRGNAARKEIKRCIDAASGRRSSVG